MNDNQTFGERLQELAVSRTESRSQEAIALYIEKTARTYTQPADVAFAMHELAAQVRAGLWR